MSQAEIGLGRGGMRHNSRCAREPLALGIDSVLLPAYVTASDSPPAYPAAGIPEC